MPQVPLEKLTLIAEGKTKLIWRSKEDQEGTVIIESKDDITAGDGAKHDVIAGKSKLATQTTCNVFRLLEACGLPVAFGEQLDDINFSAPNCDMIPYEVVVRREAHGSYLKRHPWIEKGHVFPQLIVEFFLKTTDKQWEGQPIPKDDPLIIFKDGKAELYIPNQPLHAQESFLVLDDYPLLDTNTRSSDYKSFEDAKRALENQAAITFLILEKAWAMAGGRLVDIKFEFGFGPDGSLLLADVIDNDSWRVIRDGGYIDKQVYRDGGEINEVTALYQEVAKLTGQFTIPKQSVIVWKGSDRDDISVFHSTFNENTLSGGSLKFMGITQSAHKEPAAAYQTLHRLIQEYPDSVIIAYVGRSNGLGPILAANSTVPVIAVPASSQTFPEDIWSSLRTPSDVPLMTILDPKNAMLAALQILAMRNPELYSELRFKQETRFTNLVEIS
ncbi:MAG: phosphoribosylaminoimidazolesuccinocarboxamide synthase [bacterium]|nr:phosphoribosylaminoimidazolesuccinocarboxamide synthase [bacterium]